MNQIELFRTTVSLSILYVLLNFIRENWFFPSRLILWLTVYFMIAYMRYYMVEFASSLKLNIILLIVNIVLFVGIILLTEFGGLHVSFLYDKMLHWKNNCNPFLILTSIAMFNIARNTNFKNKFINYISGLSMLIYIIHENLILRTYYRPAIWNYIHNEFGYGSVVGWVFILAIIVFLFGVISAVIYTQTVKKVVTEVSGKLYAFLRKRYLYIELFFIRN